MEDANKVETVDENGVTPIIEEIETDIQEMEEPTVINEVKDEEFIEVVGDADEVINEKEEEVK